MEVIIVILFLIGVFVWFEMETTVAEKNKRRRK